MSVTKSLRVISVILMAFGLFSFTGCQALVQNGYIAPPGPMNYQQANAVVHDPFLQADIGPDDKSMRPPDYQNPLPEPVRNQTTTQLAPWLLSR
ncbi:MAG: membrane or secreted protein [Planctomycetota bacterium]